MNSNIFVSFGLVLLVISYFLVYNFDPDQEKNMAKFIADDAIVYIEQRDIEAAVQSFKNSQLGKNITDIDVRFVGEQINLPENGIEVIELVQKNYDFFLSNPIYDELIGKRFAIAFFEVPHNDDPKQLAESIFKNAIIVIEPRHNPHVLKTLAEHYSNYHENLEFQTIQYGNHHISRITTHEGILSLSVIDGLIAASFSERQLKRSIDTFDNEVKSLADDMHFRDAFLQFEKPKRFLYVPVKTVNNIVTKLLTYLGDDGVSSLIREQLGAMKGFTGVSYGAWPNEGFVEDKIVFSYDDALVEDSIRSYLQKVPAENSMLDFTTSNPLAYYWSNTVDLSYLLRNLESLDNPDSPVYRYIQKLQTLSGKELKDILAMLGDELSLVVEKSGTDNFFPVPLGIVAFRLQSDLEAAELANNIVDAFSAPVIEQVHDSVTYLYWVASPQDGLQPLCGYWSNYLFLGNSSALLERIVDSFNNNTPLLTNKAIKRIDPGITESNNSLTYFNNTDIIALSERLLAAISTMVSLEAPDKAQRIRLVIREILLPILDGLKEYERSCTRSYFDTGMIVIESKTAVKRKNKQIEAK